MHALSLSFLRIFISRGTLAGQLFGFLWFRFYSMSSLRVQKLISRKYPSAKRSIVVEGIWHDKM